MPPAPPGLFVNICISLFIMRYKSSLCRLCAAIAFAAAFLIASGQTDGPTSYLDRPLADSWQNDSNIYRGTDAPAAEWWRGFGDPMLDSLIAIGERNNYDVGMAARRIDIARAAVRQAESGYFPQIGVDAGWTRERSSGRTAGRDGQPSTVSYFSAGATMNWEIDVFGKIRAQTRRAKADVKVSAAEYASAMLALEAEIATTYITLLVNRAQLEVARRHSESQLHIVDITETRHRTGLVSKLDIAQARTLYYSTIASIPLLEASIEASYNSLGVLLGTGRDSLPADIYAERPLPRYSLPPAAGVPADLLRRRPDIIEAERNIDAAAAQLGIARSEYLPSLSISASAGTAAHNAGDLFSGASFTYSIAPTLSWTLFDGFARRAASLSARENMRLQVDAYNMTVITAVEEVRNAMTRYTATLKYIDSTEKVVENSRESVRLSLDQYKQGLSDFYNLVEAQLNYLSYQNSLVAAQGNALTALVDLYKALGGGYPIQ